MAQCTKCDGTGVLVRYSHIKAGECFKCNGTGKQTKRNYNRNTQKETGVSKEEQEKRHQEIEEKFKQQEKQEREIKKLERQSYINETYNRNKLLINILSNKNLNKVKNDCKLNLIQSCIKQFNKNGYLSEKQYFLLTQTLNKKEDQLYSKQIFLLNYNNGFYDDIEEVIEDELEKLEFTYQELKEYPDLQELL